MKLSSNKYLSENKPSFLTGLVSISFDFDFTSDSLLFFTILSSCYDNYSFLSNRYHFIIIQ